MTFIVSPSCHPLLPLQRIKPEFSIFVLGAFLSYPHSMVTRDAAVLLGAFEESTLGRQEMINVCKHSCTTITTTEERCEGMLSMLCVFSFNSTDTQAVEAMPVQKHLQSTENLRQKKGGKMKTAGEKMHWFLSKIQRHVLYKYHISLYQLSIYFMLNLKCFGRM